MQKTKIIVVTGGVLSSLGKGLLIASIGRILVSKGFVVTALKLDPYLNLDPGTMSPFQHGEVFVTDDGAETDLDLGHYERLLDHSMTKYSSLSAGKIYDNVLRKERNGDYLGKTVQIVPHVTDEIKNNIKFVLAQNPTADFLLIEVGGTVGDIESLPFIEALRQFQYDYGRNNICFIHAAPLIDWPTSNELKTKPTQHAVKTLRENGLVPDFLVLRSEVNFDDQLREKISIHCSIPKSNVFACVDVTNIYFLVENLYNQNLHHHLFAFFNITDPKIHRPITEWTGFVQKIRAPKKYQCRLVIFGKYTQLHDAYLSIIESLKLASYELGVDLVLDLVNSDDFDSKHAIWTKLSQYDGLCVPYGFGNRGIENKIFAIEYARVHNMPFFGICLGMQLACIEYARNVLGLKAANSTEFDPDCSDQIFVLQPNQQADQNLGGTLSLGTKPLVVKPNTLAHKLYQCVEIAERHRHRYHFNNAYLNMFEQSLHACFSVKTPDGMQEVFEITNHKFFIASQYHPEFTSRPLKVNPLFMGFLNAAKKNKKTV